MTDVDDQDADAAEYAIGLMPVDERATFEDRLRRDPDLAARVLAWEDRLAPLNGAYAEDRPPKATKTSIDTRLFGKPEPATSWSLRARRWWASAAAALAAIVLFLGLQFSQTPPVLVAELDPVEAGYRFAARYDQENGALTVATLETIEAPDRALELWAIGDDGIPRSLGLLTSSDPVILTTALALEPGTTLAVSLEPTGGSPTGAPTGPVLSAGVLSDA